MYLRKFSDPQKESLQTSKTSDDPLLNVHMMKHTEVASSRISFGQGGTVIEVEMSCDLNPGHNLNRNRTASFPEFISLQTHNGRFRMVLRHANGKGPVYALYAVNWVTRGFSDPLRLPETVLGDFCSALLGLCFDIQIQPEVHDHFRYTCARNVFATLDYCNGDDADETELWYPMATPEGEVVANPLETHQNFLVATLPIETSLTFLPAHDLLEMSMSSIERCCQLREPAAAKCFAEPAGAYGVADAGESAGADAECQPANILSVTAQHFRKNRPKRFLSLQTDQRPITDNGTQVCVLRVECGNLEKHTLRTRFYQNLLVMNHRQNPLSKYHIAHSVCPNLISKGARTWAGQQFLFFECIQPVSPLYMLLPSEKDSKKSRFFSRNCRNRCRAELGLICSLFSATSDFLLLHPGSDAEFAENFLVNSETGEVYIWSFRDAVYFKGNKVSALGYHDHAQKPVPSQLETYRLFVSGMNRLAELVAAD